MATVLKILVFYKLRIKITQVWNKLKKKTKTKLCCRAILTSRCAKEQNLEVQSPNYSDSKLAPTPLTLSGSAAAGITLLRLMFQEALGARLWVNSPEGRIVPLPACGC